MHGPAVDCRKDRDLAELGYSKGDLRAPVILLSLHQNPVQIFFAASGKIPHFTEFTPLQNHV
jgi:hypothetical protein